MCTGAELPLIATLVSTAGGAILQDQAMKSADAEAARGIMRQAALQQQAGRRVNQNIQQLRQSDPEAERASAQEQFMAALQKSRAAAGGGELAGVPGASQRFTEDVGAARGAAGTESAQLAGRLARIDAPSLQRIREGHAAADTASDLSIIGGDSAGQDFLTRLRVATKRPNPWAQGALDTIGTWGSSAAGRAPKVANTTKLPRQLGDVMIDPSIRRKA